MLGAQTQQEGVMDLLVPFPLFWFMNEGIAECRTAAPDEICKERAEGRMVFAAIGISREIEHQPAQQFRPFRIAQDHRTCTFKKSYSNRPLGKVTLQKHSLSVGGVAGNSVTFAPQIQIEGKGPISKGFGT